LEITVAESAIKKLSELLSATAQGQYVRAGLRSGGCKGFEQFIELNASPSPGDIQIACGSFTVLIDKKSSVLLAGSSLEWKTTLTQSRFAFTLNRAASECSCGKSFSI
jgi:iron-sulfur cluster assembly accessory protein